jgi:hypothetical protein
MKPDLQKLRVWVAQKKTQIKTLRYVWSKIGEFFREAMKKEIAELYDLERKLSEAEKK